SITVNALLTSDIPEANLVVELLDSDLNVVDMGNSGAQLMGVMLDEGEYFITISEESGLEVAYGMQALVQTEIPACMDDLQEDNDDEATAIDLGLVYGNTLTLAPLVLCQSDDDYYGFDAMEGDAIALSFEPVPAGGLNVVVMNTDTDETLYDGLVEDNSPLNTMELTQGSYVIGVTPVAMVPMEGVTYGMRATLNEAPTEDCMDDPLEENDDVSDAQPLGAPGQDNLVFCRDDPADWYSIFLSAGSEATLEVVYTGDQTSELSAVLYDGDQAVAIGMEGMCDGTPCLTFPMQSVTVSTTFNLQIQTTVQLGEPIAYGVNLDVTGCPPDVFEPNEASMSPTALQTTCRSRGSICPSDQDWYSITTSSPDEVFVISANFFNSGGDVDLYLYADMNSDGQLPIEDRIDLSRNPSDCEDVTNADNTGYTQYWLLVRGGDLATEQEEYRLVWGASCQEDEPQLNFCAP
ncbi:MAG: hypothetical protein AAFX99_34395, partial [Myxococcota bacterium]